MYLSYPINGLMFYAPPIGERSPFPFFYQSGYFPQTGWQVSAYQQLAIQQRYIPIVCYLFDVNARGVCGCTPLHSAVASHDFNRVRILISYGAYINAVDNDGFTPLHSALYRNSFAIAKFLLEHGASIFYKSIHGETSLSLALCLKTGEYLKIANRMCELYPHARIEAEEINARKLIAHATHCGGCSQLVLKDRSAPPQHISVEWFPSKSYAWRKIIKGIRYFETQCPGMISANIQALLIDAFSLAILGNREESLAMFQRWKDGFPVVINTGCYGHISSALLWKNRMVLCDRAKKNHPTAMKYYVYNFVPDVITLKLLETIEKMSYSDQTSYTNFWFRELSRLCGCMGEFERQLEQLLNAHMTFQTAGNCSLANTEALMLPFLILCEATSVSELLSKEKELVAVYKTWAQLFQINIVQEYLRKRIDHPNPYQPDFPFLKKVIRNSTPPMDAHPKVKEERAQLEILYGRYLSLETSGRYTERNSKIGVLQTPIVESRSV